MCKKSAKKSAKKGNKKFVVIMNNPVWNIGCTTVLRYEEKHVFVYAKNAIKAVEKITDRHAILRVDKCKF